MASFAGTNYNAPAPSLDLRFAAAKSLRDQVSGEELVTFTRASSATYVDANGTIQSAPSEEPRFDHDPVTGESLGLLVEEGRTNYIENSSDYSGWTILDLDINPNAIVSPDGTLTATEFISTRDWGVSNCRFYKTGITGGSTASIYVKPGTCRSISIRCADGSSSTQYAIFNLDTKIITYGPNTNTYISASIEDVGDGWYRCWIASTTTYIIAYYSLVSSSSGENMYVWGAQLEQGSFPTSYIPTPATFTSRASTATYYDANGIIQTAAIDEARDDAYLPDENGNFISAGLLLEEQRENLLTQSEHLDSGWVYQGGDGLAPTVTSVEAPDGGLDSRLYALSLSTMRVRQDKTVPAAVYTLSVYYKPNATTILQIFLFNSAVQANVTFDTNDPNNPTVTSGRGEIVNVGNGWYRASVTTLTATDGTVCETMIYPNGGYLWGAQLEAGSYATSYIPTTASTATRSADVSTSATVTRAADVASITGANFSDWYEQSEGTIYVDFDKSTTQRQNPFAISDGTQTNRISVYYNNTTVVSYIGSSAGGYDQSVYTTSSPLSSKHILEYSSGNITPAIDGNLGSVITESNLPTNTTLFLGRDERGVTNQYMLVGHISRLSYWPTRLPDSTLITLTR